jgi:hypothetical protein
MELPWRQGHPHNPELWKQAATYDGIVVGGDDGVLWDAHPGHDSPGAWKTVAMVYAVARQTLPVCVTWAGHLTCPYPHLPQGPPPLAAPETVAATSIAIAVGGGLASVTSVRVSN